MPEFQIRIDDLRGAEIIALLEEHLRAMYRVSQPESVHALDLAGPCPVIDTVPTSSPR